MRKHLRKVRDIRLNGQGLIFCLRFRHFLLRWHVCRTELPPKNFKIDTKKRFEKREKKIRKTIRNVFEKLLAPLRPLKNISPALFNKF